VLVEATRELAVGAIAAAKDVGGDPGTIAKAEQHLAEGWLP
jgi:hypothetical protein